MELEQRRRQNVRGKIKGGLESVMEKPTGKRNEESGLAIVAVGKERDHVLKN